MIKPGYNYALNNQGYALAGIASIVKGGDAELYFKKACKKYEAATENNVNYYSAWVNWGDALFFLAKGKKEKNQRVPLLNEALDKYKTIMELNQSEDLDLLYKYALVDLELAKDLQGEDRINSYENDGDLIYQYLSQHSECEQAWQNWIETQIELYNLYNNEDRVKLDNVLNKIQSINQRIKLYCSYNISCIYSLLGYSDNALYWLEENFKSERKKEYEYIKQDENLKLIVRDYRFAILIKKYYDVDGAWPTKKSGEKPIE